MAIIASQSPVSKLYDVIENEVIEDAVFIESYILCVVLTKKERILRKKL